MIDAELQQGVTGYDIFIKNGDIASIDNFKTAIEVSLFSDARADSSQVALPEKRRGWIGDVASPIENQKFGSLLWLTEQERLTQSVLNRVVEFARQALQWLIDQGQAKTVEVSGAIIPKEGIALNIVITSFSGKIENHYVKLWENTQDGN
tara:strand:- start:1054 stop:1503 length:450 start_codon:yes stop_codon:yes gene_type:complete